MGSFKKYVCSKFQIFYSLPPPCLSLFILHVPPSMYVRFSESPPLKKSYPTFTGSQMKNQGVKREKIINFFVNAT